MTPGEHAKMRDRVRASELMALTTSERRGTYARRKPIPPVMPNPVEHRYTLPIVSERLL